MTYKGLMELTDHVENFAREYHNGEFFMGMTRQVTIAAVVVTHVTCPNILPPLISDSRASWARIKKAMWRNFPGP